MFWALFVVGHDWCAPQALGTSALRHCCRENSSLHVRCCVCRLLSATVDTAELLRGTDALTSRREGGPLTAPARPLRSGHQSFSPNKALNDFVGNVVHSSILVPYHGWRVSHRAHHGNHGHVENDESWHPVSKGIYDNMVRCACAAHFVHTASRLHCAEGSHLLVYVGEKAGSRRRASAGAS